MRRAVKAASVVVIGLLSGAVLLGLAGLPLYVFPPVDDVEDADLIYVIGPPNAARLELAEQLRRGGVSEELLVSVPAEGENSASGLAVCAQSSTSCGTPDPFTTNGETLLLEQYAERHRTQRTVVLTFTPHVSRTRYIFDKCYDGDVTVVAVEENLSPLEWAYQYVYQTAAYAKAWFWPCAGEG